MLRQKKSHSPLACFFRACPALLFTCTVAATIALVLLAPLEAILLTVTVATANTYELRYIALASATALIIGAAVGQRLTQRAARQARPAASRSN